MQVSLQGRHSGEHHHGKKWHEHANAGRKQNMVQRAPAVSDELAALCVPQIRRKGTDALQGSRPILTARRKNRGQTGNRGDVELLRVADEARLEWG